MGAEQRLREFIMTEIHWGGSPNELTDDFPLIESNLIDSMGIYHVVSFVEREFGVEILDEELVVDNFGTIKSIARLVASKREASDLRS